MMSAGGMDFGDLIAHRRVEKAFRLMLEHRADSNQRISRININEYNIW